MARGLAAPPPERTYRKFIELLDSAEWRQWLLEDAEVWTCEEDAFYQIVVPKKDVDEPRPFAEPWTKGFPDPNTSEQSVLLKIAGTTIMDLLFIRLDGGRYFVPLPKKRQSGEEEWSYYWTRDSIEYKVSKIIGEFYLFKDLEAFAEWKKMEILDTDIYHKTQ